MTSFTFLPCLLALNAATTIHGYLANQRQEPESVVLSKPLTPADTEHVGIEEFPWVNNQVRAASAWMKLKKPLIMPQSPEKHAATLFSPDPTVVTSHNQPQFPMNQITSAESHNQPQFPPLPSNPQEQIIQSEYLSSREIPEDEGQSVEQYQTDGVINQGFHVQGEPAQIFSEQSQSNTQQIPVQWPPSDQSNQPQFSPASQQFLILTNFPQRNGAITKLTQPLPNYNGAYLPSGYYLQYPAASITPRKDPVYCPVNCTPLPPSPPPSPPTNPCYSPSPAYPAVTTTTTSAPISPDFPPAPPALSQSTDPLNVFSRDTYQNPSTFNSKDNKLVPIQSPPTFTGNQQIYPDLNLTSINQPHVSINDEIATPVASHDQNTRYVLVPLSTYGLSQINQQIQQQQQQLYPVNQPIDGHGVYLYEQPLQEEQFSPVNSALNNDWGHQQRVISLIPSPNGDIHYEKQQKFQQQQPFYPGMFFQMEKSSMENQHQQQQPLFTPANPSLNDRIVYREQKRCFSQ